MSNSPPPPNAVLLSLLNGALASLNRSETAQAEKLLAQALALAPRNPDALQLMGVIRRAQNRLEEARSFYLQSLASKPAQPQVHHNLGNLYYAQQKHRESVEAQKQAIRLKRDYIEAYAGLALALSGAQEHDEAIAICNQALRMQPANFTIRHILAAELIEAQRHKEAETLLRTLLTEAGISQSSAASLTFNLALALRRQGQYEQAIAALESIRDHSQNIPYFDYEVGQLLFQIGKYAEAQDHFRKALADRPEDVRILASAALTAVRLSQIPQARDLAQKAMLLDGDNGRARAVLARTKLAEGHIQDGCEILRNLLTNDSIDIDDWASSTITDSADALDKQGEYDAAFAIICEHNRRKRRDVGTPRFVRALDDARRLRKHFEASSPWLRTPALHKSSLAPSGHVFVVGFMRSGTTLLATALASHDMVVAADEVDFFSDTARAFLTSEKGLNDLAELPDAKIEDWQRRYWEGVAASGLSVAGSTFVEKMPLNSIRLPLISRLFPEAKILYALRDPRDVVLSCIRQKFELTQASYEFLDLEDCARFYSEVMHLVERYREVLPLNMIDCRYEDVVSNYADTLRHLCAFIGIDWRDSMLHFFDSAGFVNPLSASAQQVRTGLYRSSIGQWRHYREHLAPAAPILSPWISKFGYPEN